MTYQFGFKMTKQEIDTSERLHKFLENYKTTELRLKKLHFVKFWIIRSFYDLKMLLELFSKALI